MKTSKKQSAQRQILEAITQYGAGRLDCAMTLAGAAEGILPSASDHFLFQALSPDMKAVGIDMNLVINWLKHASGPEEVEISEFEACLTVARAITKFIAVYHQSTPPFEGFLTAAHAAGHLPNFAR